ncbi:hypothetical protein CPB86DRAFT_790051 [Serendipita vermifera]|nr:hypothetical protein CPB86DRAFT_790051 [Serendipita vermifera]
MAIPESMTTADISGRYFLNQKLSDSTDQILTLQGVRWVTRKIINNAGITVNIKHYTAEVAEGGDGLEHIDSTQTLTGGIPGTAENRTFSGLPRDHTDHLFGPVKAVSKRVRPSEVTKELSPGSDFLSKGWTEDVLGADKGLIFTTASSDTEVSGKTWTADQVWGFEIIDGVKRYTRHVHFYTPDETVEARMVYDYLGEAQA